MEYYCVGSGPGEGDYYFDVISVSDPTFEDKSPLATLAADGYKYVSLKTPVEYSFLLYHCNLVFRLLPLRKRNESYKQ